MSNMDPRAFEQRTIAQRRRLRTTPQELLARIESSPYGERSREVLRQAARHESTGAGCWGAYPWPPVIVRGAGAAVWDADGREYVDMSCGFGVSNVGHADPRVAAAIAQQAAELIHYFDFPNVGRERLAARLAELAPGERARRVAFAVTGAEAIDLAIKMARWYTGAPLVLSAYGGYHGTTAGTMALTTKGAMWGYWNPVLPHDSGHLFIPYSYPYRCPVGAEPEHCAEACLEFIRRMLTGRETPIGDPSRPISNAAAILLEPMQASAGYVIPGRGYLQGMRELCDEFDLLFIDDEIQAGMGRSGRMWACEHEGVVPDIMTVSKGLASGIPISAVIADEQIATSWGPGAHVATFAATPVATAAANATLDIFAAEDLPARAAASGAYLRERLDELAERHPIVGWIDSAGLFVGVELVRDRATKEPAAAETRAVHERCITDGLLFQTGGPLGNRLQLVAPLVIEREQIDRAIKILDRAFGEVERRGAIGQH